MHGKFESRMNSTSNFQKRKKKYANVYFKRIVSNRKIPKEKKKKRKTIQRDSIRMEKLRHSTNSVQNRSESDFVMNNKHLFHCKSNVFAYFKLFFCVRETKSSCLCKRKHFMGQTVVCHKNHLLCHFFLFSFHFCSENLWRRPITKWWRTKCGHNQSVISLIAKLSSSSYWKW